MKKMDINLRISLGIRINGFNHIISFFADTIYIFLRSEVVTEVALTLLITE